MEGPPADLKRTKECYIAYDRFTYIGSSLLSIRTEGRWSPKCTILSLFVEELSLIHRSDNVNTLL